MLALALAGAAALALAQGATSAPAGPEVLSLTRALHRADSAAYANRIARGGAREAAAGATAALAGFLPSLRAEGGYVRTTDPLGAFGFVLRQRTVTPAAFDPGRLNDPAAIGDVGAALVIEQPLVNADAWLGRSAAAHAAAAGGAQRDWTRSSVRLDVVRAYYGAVLAGRAVATLEAASRAAHEHRRQAEALAANGMVTRSDALLAAVRAGEVDARLAGARAAGRNARSELALLLGAPGDTAFGLPADLPAIEAIRRLSASAALDSAAAVERADVRAARLGWAAARRDALRAKGAYLPRLNGFARYDWHSSDRVFGGRSSWTVGVMAVWSPFSGGAQLADTRATAARADAARASAEAAEGRARVEIAARADDLAVAHERLAIAERAIDQAEEAHRIVARKYEGGLASVVDLLTAAATDTEAQLRHAQARYDTIVADASLRHARGRSLDGLRLLEDQTP